LIGFSWSSKVEIQSCLWLRTLIRSSVVNLNQHNPVGIVCQEKYGITEILLTYLILQTPSETLETTSSIFPLHTPAAT